MTNKEKLEQAIKLIKEVREEDYSEPHEVNLTAKFVDNGVLVEWNPFDSEGSDLLYYAEELHEKWQHSVRRYTGDFKTEVGEILIGTKDNREQYTWHFKLETQDNEWATELEKNQDEPEPEPLDLFYGFWYSRHVPETELKKLCTVGQDRDDAVGAMQEVIDSGRKVIPSIGGFEDAIEQSGSNWKYAIRRRLGWSTDNFKQVGWENIAFINLEDEPTGMTQEQMDYLVQKAQEEYDAPVTFMHTRSMLLRGQFSNHLKYVGVNNYPLFPDENIEKGYADVKDYASFKDHTDRVLDDVRQRIDNPTIVMTAQTFYSTNESKWRKPEPESAEWYLRYAKESGDIHGILFWTWGDQDSWVGLENIPELEDAWVQAIKKYS